jgi:hypothetical protein
MRLKPGLSAERAYEMLAVSATLNWGLTEAAALETNLRSISEAMAVIGALEIPDDTEPLFGGEDGLILEGASL